MSGPGAAPPPATTADDDRPVAADDLGAVLPALPRATARGVDLIVFPPRARYLEAARALRDFGFELLADLCAVDYLTHPGRPLPDGVAPERFEVVANLLSLSRRQRVRLRVQVPEHDPEVDSLIDVYPGVDAMEREAYDLVGIRFAGHPDLSRILMPEGWEGHPLRKDYGVGRVPIQFKEAPGPR